MAWVTLCVWGGGVCSEVDWASNCSKLFPPTICRKLVTARICSFRVFYWKLIQLETMSEIIPRLFPEPLATCGCIHFAPHHHHRHHHQPPEQNLKRQPTAPPLAPTPYSQHRLPLLPQPFLACSETGSWEKLFMIETTLRSSRWNILD